MYAVKLSLAWYCCIRIHNRASYVTAYKPDCIGSENFVFSLETLLMFSTIPDVVVVLTVVFGKGKRPACRPAGFMYKSEYGESTIVSADIRMQICNQHCLCVMCIWMCVWYSKNWLGQSNCNNTTTFKCLRS